jgi:hypothetical protein
MKHIEKFNEGKENKDTHQILTSNPHNLIDKLIKFINKNTDYNVYNDPCWDDSSEYGLIITKSKLSKKELNKISKDINE